MMSQLLCLLGFLFDVTGNYDIPFVVCGSIQAVGGLCAFCVYVMTRRKSAKHLWQHCSLHSYRMKEWLVWHGSIVPDFGSFMVTKWFWNCGHIVNMHASACWGQVLANNCSPIAACRDVARSSHEQVAHHLWQRDRAISAILRGWVTVGLNFRLKIYVSHQHLSPFRWGNGHTTTLPLEVFAQRNFVADFIQLILTLIRNDKIAFEPPFGDLGETYVLHL